MSELVYGSVLGGLAPAWHRSTHCVVFIFLIKSKEEWRDHRPSQHTGIFSPLPFLLNMQMTTTAQAQHPWQRTRGLHSASPGWPYPGLLSRKLGFACPAQAAKSMPQADPGFHSNPANPHPTLTLHVVPQPRREWKSGSTCPCAERKQGQGTLRAWPIIP